MSLIVASTASRRIRHQLISSSASSAYVQSSILLIGRNAPAAATRPFSGAKGSGLRRIQDKGRHNKNSAQTQTPQLTQTSNAKNASSNAGSSSSNTSSTSTDPHFLANERIYSEVATGRQSGTEAISSLTREQKLSNYAMATGLLAFVCSVFYYSLASVGGAEKAKQLFMGGNDEKDGEGASIGFEEFLKEANEGRSEEEKRMEAELAARGEARELAELESTTTARLKAEGVEDAIVAASANEEEEREMARTAGFEEGNGEAVKRRPLWKRVVFFWRRE